MRPSLLALALLSLAQPACAVQHPPPAPEVHKLGTVRFDVSCSSAVRPDFNRTVALLHSFAFPDAVKGFTAVLDADPKCAMAGWGLAMSAWGNPVAAGQKSPAQIERGLAAVSRARSVGRPTARERAYIEAVAHLYEHADSLDQRRRLLAYRDAMAALTKAEPADTEAAIFHALAQVAAADPTDKTYASQLAAGATLERLFAVLPDHPGLAHYIIHAYDFPALANRGLAAARRYAEIAPEVSHAEHMPSHIYTRVGAWRASITANIAAAAAAEREGATAEQLHATDYQVYAYLQIGQDREAQRIVASLPLLAGRLDPSLNTSAPPAAGYFAIAAIPARYALERGQWAEAARLTVTPSPVPFADAMTGFARALGAARMKDTVAARAAVADLERLRDVLADRREAYWRDQVEIQRLGAAAWLTLAEGRNDEALATMRTAVEREAATEKNAMSPGPLAPARELLGEMLLSLNQPAEALAAFEASLRNEPNRHRSIAGAAEAARKVGDTAKAAHYNHLLVALAGPMK